MKIISHRGNLNGPSPTENDPGTIDKVLSCTDFDVEIDVWHINNDWFLGHDKPKYRIPLEWLILNSNELWMHAKNLAAYQSLLENDAIQKVFWHQKDDFSLVKNGLIWTYPDLPLTTRSIANIHEPITQTPLCYGICTDYPKSINNFKK